MYQPKIYIGTGYCDENKNELKQCCEKVNKQKNVIIEHEIFYTSYIWKDTFQKMYDTWGTKKQDFDLFIQLDADIVLINDTIVSYMYNLLNGKKSYNQIVFPLYDFLSDTNLLILNCYKPTVKFNKLTHIHRFDMEYSNYKRFPRKIIDPIVGTHSGNPTILTAFHYGWHRQLKTIATPGQKTILNNVKNSYEKTKNEYRGHAVAGIKYATKYMRETKDTSAVGYKNVVFLEHYNNYIKKVQEQK